MWQWQLESGPEARQASKRCARRLVSPLLIRRFKGEVANDFPANVDHDHECELGKLPGPVATCAVRIACCCALLQASCSARYVLRLLLLLLTVASC